jgi:hypothetical protein
MFCTSNLFSSVFYEKAQWIVHTENECAGRIVILRSGTVKTIMKGGRNRNKEKTQPTGDFAKMFEVTLVGRSFF